MAQQEIEVILTRQLASYLALPIWILDTEGRLVFYNEPAEAILGTRFDETGAMAEEEWAATFTPSDEHGETLATDQLPIVIALTEGRPFHRGFWIRGLDGVSRYIEATAFPLVGQDDRNLGAVAIFWEDR